MRYTGPKAKLCRREGANLFGTEKYDRIMERKPAKPGASPTHRPAKPSEYARQLREKQKLKLMFGLTEKQLLHAFNLALVSEDITSTNILRHLETRLDNVLYRAGIARTRMQARQMASHGLFMLNGKRIDVPSAQVKPGDKITVKESRKNSSLFQGFKELKKDISPSWIQVDQKNIAIEVKSIPADDEVEQVIDAALIVEFYSR